MTKKIENNQNQQNTSNVLHDKHNKFDSFFKIVDTLKENLEKVDTLKKEIKEKLEMMIKSFEEFYDAELEKPLLDQTGNNYELFVMKNERRLIDKVNYFFNF